MRIYGDADICRKTKLAEREPVRRALSNLKRDLCKRASLCGNQGRGASICLEDAPLGQEEFQICAEEGKLVIGASDVLGFVYGIYAVSREILGIENFWFWNDQAVEKEEYIEVPGELQIISRPYAVHFRGWFVNDEVLLHTWKTDGREDKPWEMVFEALLRCGGNLVIPGTGKNADRYESLASSMGLFITHHHAQPLGAEMFVQAYPNLEPSYDKYKREFEALWKAGIQRQKNMKVIWGLGFRGQGDYPFWVNDSRYQTKESRGELLSSILQRQYELVKSEVRDAVCCTNLYGEMMELYREGYLKIPEDVIKIWADNGFGKMVTRRQENQNPRIPSLPAKRETGKHGLYYHVSFYDLQAANHITMLPNSPEFVSGELKKALSLGAGEYWIINCSNVKPHVYFLDLLAKIWQQGNVDTEEHRREYVRTYYGERHLDLISQCLRDYHRYALSYGMNKDDHAGEQFANHVARILISQYMKDKDQRAGDLLWATDAGTLGGQVRWYRKLCEKGAADYREYLRECRGADAELHGREQRLFEDSLLLQAKIHFACFSGAALVCGSLEKAFQGEYQQAFYLAGCAREKYLDADSAMRMREHGKWAGFYENECLTDVKQTAWVLEGLMSYVRNLGDGPHFYKWQREFLYAEEDRKVMLILNMENHLRDGELFRLMKQKWEE